MPCVTHGTVCAYQTEDPANCSFCHATWEKVTRPMVVNGKYQSGYGETPLEHVWRHALTMKQADAAAARWATRKAVA